MERQDPSDNIDLASLFGTQPLFEPEWARTPPQNPYAGRDDTPGDSFRSGRDDRFPRDRRFPRREDGRSGGFRRDGDRPPRREGGGKPFRRDGNRPEGGFRRDGERKSFRNGDRRPFRRDGAPRPPAEPLFLKFSFFPDRATLATISENIRATGRVFSLVSLAKLFLSHENSYSVKIERLAEAEPRPGRPLPEKPAAADKPGEAPEPGAAAKPAAAPTLCQCLLCKRVFRSLPKAEAHAFTAHLEAFFDIERIETPSSDAPVSCVAKCGMTGELLGPPNAHAYTARLHEIWKTKFPNMLWTDYLSRVQVLRDEESIAAWKEQTRFKTVYRPKAEAPKKAEEAPAPAAAEEAPAPGAPAEAEAAPEAEAAAPAAAAREEMTRAQAEEWTRAHRRSQLLRISPRCILTGAQTGEIDDPAIRNAFAREKAREERFPLTLILALRTALKRMRLHVFKLGGRETWVAAAEPKYFSLDTLAGEEKRVVEAVLSPAEGKATRRGVLAALAPDKAEDSPEALAILGTIRKLTQAGHVLLFEDGTLKALVRAEPPNPAENPAGTPENPAEEAEKAPKTAEKAPETAENPAEEVAKAPETAENPSETAEKPAEEAEKPEISAKTAEISAEPAENPAEEAEKAPETAEKPAEEAEKPEISAETAEIPPETAPQPAAEAADAPAAEEDA